MLAHIHLPIGNTNLRSPYLAPELVLAAEMPLNSWLELSGKREASGYRMRQACRDLGFGRHLTESLGMSSRDSGEPAMAETLLSQAETGNVSASSNLQLDCTGGVIFLESEPAGFWNGRSVRFRGSSYYPCPL